MNPWLHGGEGEEDGLSRMGRDAWGCGRGRGVGASMRMRVEGRRGLERGGRRLTATTEGREHALRAGGGSLCEALGGTSSEHGEWNGEDEG